MLFAERAVFAQNKSVGIVLLVLKAVVVSTLAFGAFKSDFGSCRLGCHIKNSIQKNYTPWSAITILTHFQGDVNLFCKVFKKYFLILHFLCLKR